MNSLSRENGGNNMYGCVTAQGFCGNKVLKWSERDTWISHPQANFAAESLMKTSAFSNDL